MKKDFPGWLITVIIIAAIALVLLLFAYPLKLAKFGLSDDPAHWGQFGDYYNMLISIINTVAVIVLSWLVYSEQVRRNNWEKVLLIISLMATVLTGPIKLNLLLTKRIQLLHFFMGKFIGPLELPDGMPIMKIASIKNI